MPRTKEIHLANPFPHPFQGQIVEGTSVIVTEPGFDQIRVHHAMSHHVMQALVGMEKHKALFESGAEDAPPTLDQDGNDLAGENVLALFAMAIEDEAKYLKIVENIKRIMTNNAAIARIAETGAPITDAAWKGIGETNDVQGVNRILSVFASFFLTGPQVPQSQNANGSAGLTDSASPQAVESRVRMPHVVRYEN